VKFAVVVVSPPGYPHSAAFDEVALTLERGLVRLGHDVVITRALTGPELVDRRAIVLGAHLAPRAGLTIPPGSILYNLEQIDGASAWLTPALIDLYRRHPVWDYSATNADRLVARGVPRPQVVPLGYVPELQRVPASTGGEDIDVLFYGSMNPRRQRVLDDLKRAGVRAQAVFGVYGAARDALIARSKLIINIHYYEAKVFEVVRVSYLLANRKVVVSERGADRQEEAAFEGAVAFAEYEGLVPACLQLLADPAARAQRAAAGFGFFSALPEETFLAPALAALQPTAATTTVVVDDRTSDGISAPIGDPWAGSRPLRVLIAPDLSDVADRHERVLGALAQQMGHMLNVTIGVALPRDALSHIPASIERAAACGQGDLLLLERPADSAGWQRLLGAASLFVATGPQPELRSMAQTLGLTIAEVPEPRAATISAAEPIRAR
jgi:hypothetical protein